MDSALPPPPSYPKGYGPEVSPSVIPPPAQTNNASSNIPAPAYPTNRPALEKSTVPSSAYTPGLKSYKSNANTSSSPAVNVNSSSNQESAKTKNTLNTAESAAKEMSQVRTSFAYTQGGFWGGPNAEFSVLAVLACFPLTGLLGLDHHYMRSPMTAALKTILNIFTLGFWYFYDMGQVLTESDHVKKYGYSVPVFGPIGLGAGLFPEKNQATVGASPIRFMLYSVATTIGSIFGVDHLAAGDFKGFLAKLFSLPIWILLMWWNPLYWVAMFCALIWAGYSIYRLWFQTEDLFVRGVARFFPFTIFMDEFRCANEAFGPNRPCSQDMAPPKSIWSAMFEYFKGIPAVGDTIATVEKTVEVAKMAGTVAVEVGKKTVAPVIGAAGAAIRLGGDVVSAGQQATSEAISTAQKFTDPAFLAEVAATKVLPSQKGGGNSESKSPNAIYALVAATVGASFLTQLFRKSEYFKLIPDILSSTIKVRDDLPPM